MNIERRIIILSGEGSGSVKVTSVENEHKMEVALFSLPYKRYYFLIKEKEVYEYELEGTRIAVLHKGELDLSLAHFIISDGERVVLYGSLSREKLWKSNMPIRRKSVAKTNISTIPPPPKTDISTEKTDYDDGAIAKENYYERRGIDGAEGSMAFSEEYKNYILSNSEVERAQKPVSVEGAFTIPPVKKEESVIARGRKLTFFEEVKENIDRLFLEGERVKELEENMPLTRWVKVPYGNKYYIVGLIGSPAEYLCYGLPSRYTTPPPSELGEGVTWLPKDLRKPMEEGYFVLYQSLVSGETIKNQ